MKALSQIVKENLSKSDEEVDESRLTKKAGKAIGSGAKKLGNSLWGFAKDVATQKHVTRN